MSKRSRQKRDTATAPRQRYSREMHGQGLVDFMAAFDHDDISDGAWQAMLEDGGAAYAQEMGVDIDPHRAFMEYVSLTGDQA